jgi:tryptophanyl-tRNA synthetase
MSNKDRIDQEIKFEVTPWNVEGSVDYDKLIEKFGTTKITLELISKMKKLLGNIHPMISMEFFFSHRDFDWILDKFENKEKFYLYTGRGPSGMVHLGHLMPWLFTKYLQDEFDSNLLFQLTDDEKFLYGKNSRKEIEKYVSENILDIIATGFNSKRTKIIVDTKHISSLYPTALEISKRITFSTARAVFGFNGSTNIGMIGFPPIQAVPCFLPSIIEGQNTPVLIPAAIDQDPYWRMTRDVAEKMGYYKPAQIHSKFLPSLEQVGKMSSSKPETAIFTTDTQEEASRKLSQAFTGGQPTTSLQRMLGGNPDRCPVFSYLKYLYDSPKESMERQLECRGGNLLCGECKHDLTKSTTTFLSEFQRKREKAVDMVPKFMYNQ